MVVPAIGPDGSARNQPGDGAMGFARVRFTRLAVANRAALVTNVRRLVLILASSDKKIPTR
jgi:hypothetical protein